MSLDSSKISFELRRLMLYTISKVYCATPSEEIVSFSCWKQSKVDKGNIHLVTGSCLNASIIRHILGRYMATEAVIYTTVSTQKQLEKKAISYSSVSEMKRQRHQTLDVSALSYYMSQAFSNFLWFRAGIDIPLAAKPVMNLFFLYKNSSYLSRRVNSCHWIFMVTTELKFSLDLWRIK